MIEEEKILLRKLGFEIYSLKTIDNTVYITFRKKGWKFGWEIVLEAHIYNGSENSTNNTLYKVTEAGMELLVQIPVAMGFETFIKAVQLKVRL